MIIDPISLQLPINEIAADVKQQLSQHNTLIVHAPPGAGKSTLLPLLLKDEPWLKDKKIMMLEPRRLAAKTITERMSDLLGKKIGEEVGYRIRFENKVSATTKIEVLTEGILTRMLHSDASLEGVGLVIFDEFHERNIHADVALALCREAQQLLRPDLRILVMSATLNTTELADLLKAPICESKGKQYPVNVIYDRDNDIRMIAELTAVTVKRAAKEQKEGDILVFLPGKSEIKRCEAILRKELPSFATYPLFGQLSSGQQFAALMPRKDGKRKIVLATSIAETSLTIEGVSCVVDSGFGRTARFDPRSGLSRLETVEISIDSADQRAGRAGRLGPGTCYRLWSKATHDRKALHRVPEIVEADLSSLALDLAQWGIAEPTALAWLTPPPKGTLAQANEMLHQINALADGKITAHGKAVHKLPAHPRIAHMLIWAKEQDLMPLATDIAAILEERDPLQSEAGTDINIRIEALRRIRKEQLHQKGWNKIEKVAEQYRKIFQIQADNSPVDPYETGLIIANAYPERIACARPGNNAQFQLANGRLASIHHADDLAHEAWMAVASLDARDGMGRIFLASPLNPRDLAPMVKQQEIIKWDSKKGGLVASADIRIGNIILQSKPLPNPDKQQIINALLPVIKAEGEHLLDFNEQVIGWQNRVLSLSNWNPDRQWPDVSTQALLTDLEWLMPYLDNVKRNEDLKRINLKEALQFHLDYEKQQLLDELAPETIKLPSGSVLPIEYFADGATPRLSVRLQEVFGWNDSPKVNNGSIPLLMQLLSPGYKPVQLTTDLRSFWTNTYFEVKKELKRRYPKHSWPEYPLLAEAVSGVKRKKN